MSDMVIRKHTYTIYTVYICVALFILSLYTSIYIVYADVAIYGFMVGSTPRSRHSVDVTCIYGDKTYTFSILADFEALMQPNPWSPPEPGNRIKKIYNVSGLQTHEYQIDMYVEKGLSFYVVRVPCERFLVVENAHGVWFEEWDLYLERKRMSENQRDLLTMIKNGFRFIADVIKDSFTLIINGIKFSSSIITHVFVDGIKIFSNFIGIPGDVESVGYAAMYRIRLQEFASNNIVGRDVQDVLNCVRPLKDVKGLLNVYREKDLNKTICDVENSKPRGILGMFSTFFYVASSMSGVAMFIAQHFIEINVIIVVAILTYSMIRSINRKSLEPLFEGFKYVGAIIKFYWNALKFIVEIVHNAARFIVQSIPAIEIIANKLKDFISWIIDRLFGWIS